MFDGWLLSRDCQLLMLLLFHHTMLRGPAESPHSIARSDPDPSDGKANKNKEPLKQAQHGNCEYVGYRTMSPLNAPHPNLAQYFWALCAHGQCKNLSGPR